MAEKAKEGFVWRPMEKRVFEISNLKIIYATREIARFVVDEALKAQANEISFKDVQNASRSFLDELYLLSKNKNIQIIDIPASILPLYKLIERSHIEHKLHAPEIKVTISNKTFA